MPNLLSINNYNYRRGGAEAVFLDHNLLFRAEGWDVAEFCMHHESNLDSAWSKYFVSEIEFGNRYSPIRQLRNASKIIYSMEARRKLAGLIAGATPALAHLHNIYHHISPAILSLLKQHGIPVVMTVHDLKIACPSYKMISRNRVCERCKGGQLFNVVKERCVKESLVLSGLVYLESTLHRFLQSYENNVDVFVVPSRFYQQKLVEWGWPQEVFEHIPNFVNVSACEPRYQPGEKFVYFGRLGSEKGLVTLVRAAVAAEVPLQIIGTGPEEAELRRLVGQIGANVTFSGYLSGESLYSEVRAARAVVLPSEWYENAPISVLEAYALGKPVIGANIGGIPELIKEGTTGITFESGSAQSLASALRFFADADARDIEAMGRHARRWVEDEFTAQRYVERFVKLYQRMGVS